MSGKLSQLSNEENDSVYKSNIEYAAKVLERENLLCVIEPINQYSVPNYYLNNYDRGIKRQQFCLLITTFIIFSD